MAVGRTRADLHVLVDALLYAQHHALHAILIDLRDLHLGGLQVGLRLDKGMQCSDWQRRPLSPQQLQCASRSEW